MKLANLVELEKQIMEEVVRRRKLGGYSMEAEGILLMGEVLLKVIGHLIENTPSAEAPKSKK